MTYDAPRFIGKCSPTQNADRVPIKLDPDVKKRLVELLWTPEFETVGYSAFVNRACEIAETEIAERRRRTEVQPCG